MVIYVLSKWNPVTHDSIEWKVAVIEYKWVDRTESMPTIVSFRFLWPCGVLIFLQGILCEWVSRWMNECEPFFFNSLRVGVNGFLFWLSYQLKAILSLSFISPLYLWLSLLDLTLLRHIRRHCRFDRCYFTLSVACRIINYRLIMHIKTTARRQLWLHNL